LPGYLKIYLIALSISVLVILALKYIYLPAIGYKESQQTQRILALTGTVVITMVLWTVGVFITFILSL